MGAYPKGANNRWVHKVIEADPLGVKTVGAKNHGGISLKAKTQNTMSIWEKFGTIGNHLGLLGRQDNCCHLVVKLVDSDSQSKFLKDSGRK